MLQYKLLRYHKNIMIDFLICEPGFTTVKGFPLAYTDFEKFL